MPYIVKAEKIDGMLPDVSVESEDIEAAHRIYHAMQMEGYRRFYIVTPDGRRLDYVSDIAAEKDKVRNEAQKRGGVL